MKAARPGSDLARTVGLLGGEKAIHAEIRNAMDAHDVLLKGLPADALLHLVSVVSFLERGDALKKTVGLGLRTLQRYKAKSARPRLGVEQGDRAWRFAAIFAHAVDVMGSEKAAEAWMNATATGLDNRTPVDLLATSAGVAAVEEHLTRLEYGVHA